MSKTLKFEEAMAELERITQRLESRDGTLDESIADFEKAVALIKICNDKLEKAEQKVKILIEGEDGAVTDMPFKPTNDET